MGPNRCDNGCMCGAGGFKRQRGCNGNAWKKRRRSRLPLTAPCGCQVGAVLHGGTVGLAGRQPTGSGGGGGSVPAAEARAGWLGRCRLHSGLSGLHLSA